MKRLRRVLALGLVSLLAVLGPGFNGYLIAAQEVQGRRVFDQASGRFHNVRDARVASALDLLRRRPEIVQQLDPEMRRKAEEYLLRVDGYAGGSPELVQELQTLERELGNLNGRDPGLILARFFVNSGNAMSRLDDSRIHQTDVVVASPYERRFVTTNANASATAQDMDIREIERDFRRYTLRTERPDRRGEMHIEQIGFVAVERGVEKQKVAYSRSFGETVRMIIRLFHERPDIQDVIDDPNTNEETRRSMREQLAQVRRDFPQEFIAYERELSRLERRIRENPEFTPTELRQMAEELKAQQNRLMAYYNSHQLELLQKTMIAQYIGYFTSTLGTTHNPFEKRDINTMKISELQDILRSFESGSIPGYGWTAWAAGWAAMDRHRDVAVELQAIAAEAIQYLGFAAEAQAKLYDPRRVNQRILHPDRTEQEIAAIIAEIDQWVRLAQLQIQRFEMHATAVQLWRLANNKLKGDMGIASNPELKREAERLLARVSSELAPELRRLASESKEAMIRQTAVALTGALYKARYSSLPLESIQEELKEMIAQSRQLRSLFQAQKFSEFLHSPEFRRRLTSVTAAQEVTGAVYRQFLDDLDPETRRALESFDELTRLFQRLAGMREIARIVDGLAEAERILKRLLPLLKLPAAPSAEAARIQDERLRVMQANIGAIAQNYSANMRMFDMVAELDLYMTKYASSQKTDSDKWYEFRFLDRFTNFVSAGGRDAAGHAAARLWDQRAWQVLKGNEQVRKDVLSHFARGDYNGGMQRLAAMDPAAAERARRSFQRDRENPQPDFDIIGLLTRGTPNENLTVANTVLTSAFAQMGTYMKAFMAGAAAVDFGVMAVVTAGIGPLIAGGARVAGAAALNTARIMRISQTANQLKTMGQLQRMMQMLNAIGAGGLHYFGRASSNISRTIRLQMGLGRSHRDMMQAWRLTQYPKIVLNTMKFQAQTTAMMALASTGISAGMHGIHEVFYPGASPFKSYGDAMMEGAIGGASFGAKGAFIFLLNPIPTSAFGKTGVGGWVRGIGESAGPLDWLATRGARALAGPAARPDSVARAGLWGALGQAPARIGLTWSERVLQGARMTLAKGGAFMDGAMKFMVWAEAAKEVAIVGSFALYSAFGGDRSDFSGGHRLNKIVSAHHWGESLQHTSWIFMPMQPGHSRDDAKRWKDAERGLNKLDRQGQLLERVMGREAMEKGKIEVPKDVRHMSWGEMFSFGWAKLRGKQVERPTHKIEVTPELQMMVLDKVARRLDQKGEHIKTSELVALAWARDDLFNNMAQFSEILATLKAKSEQGTLDAKDGRLAMQIMLLPSIREKADALLRERLMRDPNGLLNILEQIRGWERAPPAQRERGIKIDGEVISNQKVLEQLGNTVGWVVLEQAPLLGQLRRGRTVLDRLKAMSNDFTPVKSNAEVVAEVIAAEVGYRVKKGLVDGMSPEAAAKTISAAIEARMGEILKLYNSPKHEQYRWAMERHRSAMEGSALDLYNGQNLVREIMTGRYKKGSPQATELIERSLALSKEALIRHKIEDAHGTKIWEFGYKPVQQEIYRELLDVMTEKGGSLTDGLKTYLLAKTGAGKSLLAMVMFMPIAKALVKEAKLEGIDFNTHGEVLRAQAQSVYRSYFRGRAPDFRIQTYSELMGQELFAKEAGQPRPSQRRLQINDEKDQLFLDPPTSLGAPAGEVSKTNPIWGALEKMRLDLVAFQGRTRFEGDVRSHINNDAAFGRGMREMAAQSRARLLEAVKEAMRSPDPKIRREAKEFMESIAAERYNYTMEGYVQTMLIDFYGTARLKDLSDIMMIDPVRGQVLSIHGKSTVYDNLDTGGQRTFLELMSGTKVTNPYKNLEMTDAADLLMTTRFMIALSGTLPEMLRPSLEKAGVIIRGNATRTADGKFHIAVGQEQALQGIAKAAFERIVAGGKDGKKALSAIVINTPGELQKIFEILTDPAGPYKVPASKIVRFQVGDTFRAEQRLQGKVVREQQNVESLASGQAEYVLLTVGTSRGLDMPLKEYVRVHMFGLSPERMSLVNYTQSQGRIDPDRLRRDGALRDFTYFTDMGSLRSDPNFLGVGRRVFERAHAGSDAATVRRIAEGVRQLRGERQLLTPAELKASDAEVVQTFLGRIGTRTRQNWVTELRENISKIEKSNQPKEIKAELLKGLQAELKRIENLRGEELVQKVLENPDVLGRDALHAARELVAGRRVQELIGADVQRIRAERQQYERTKDPAALERIRRLEEAAFEKLLANERFFEIVLHEVQRKVELDALTGSGIMRLQQRPRVLEPEDVQFAKAAGTSLLAALGTAGLGLATGGAATFWPQLAPFQDAFFVLAGFMTLRFMLLKAAGGQTPELFRPAPAPPAAPSAPARN